MSWIKVCNTKPVKKLQIDNVHDITMNVNIFGRAMIFTTGSVRSRQAYLVLMFKLDNLYNDCYFFITFDWSCSCLSSTIFITTVMVWLSWTDHAWSVHQSISKRMRVVPAQSVDSPIGGAKIGGVRAPEMNHVKLNKHTNKQTNKQTDKQTHKHLKYHSSVQFQLSSWITSTRTGVTNLGDERGIEVQ